MKKIIMLILIVITICNSIACNEYHADNDMSEISAMNTFCNPDTGTLNGLIVDGLDVAYNELNIKCEVTK